ncbi:MAG: hypothetical protein GXY58_18800 [Planctomycetaceae bacterium]|nr:hypothetical protein [Planctomycetaceae bacterium]
MKHESWQRGVVSSLMALLLTALWTAAVPAQEAVPPDAADQPPAASTAAETNAAKKPRGRLPAHYGKVVTDKQREQIYEIQAKFTEQIVKLQEQLTALAAKRDAEIEQVLTEEQRAEITRLKNERKSRRANSSADETPPSGS